MSSVCSIIWQIYGTQCVFSEINLKNIKGKEGERVEGREERKNKILQVVKVLEEHFTTLFPDQGSFYILSLELSWFICLNSLCGRQLYLMGSCFHCCVTLNNCQKTLHLLELKYGFLNISPLCSTLHFGASQGMFYSPFIW